MIRITFTAATRAEIEQQMREFLGETENKASFHMLRVKATPECGNISKPDLIEMYRNETGVGLKEAKEQVEFLLQIPGAHFHDIYTSSASALRSLRGAGFIVEELEQPG